MDERQNDDQDIKKDRKEGLDNNEGLTRSKNNEIDHAYENKSETNHKIQINEDEHEVKKLNKNHISDNELKKEITTHVNEIVEHYNKIRSKSFRERKK